MSRCSTTAGSEYRPRSTRTVYDELEELLNRRVEPPNFPRMVPSDFVHRGVENHIKQRCESLEAERSTSTRRLQAALARNKELENLLKKTIAEHEKVVDTLSAKIDSQSRYHTSRIRTERNLNYALRREIQDKINSLELELDQVRSARIAQEEMCYNPKDHHRAMPYHAPSSPMSTSVSPASPPTPPQSISTATAEHPQHKAYQRSVSSVTHEQIKLLQQTMTEMEKNLNARIDQLSIKFEDSEMNLRNKTVLEESETIKRNNEANAKYSEISEQILKSNQQLFEVYGKLANTQVSQNEKIQHLADAQNKNYKEVLLKLTQQATEINNQEARTSENFKMLDKAFYAQLRDINAALDHQKHELLVQRESILKQQQANEDVNQQLQRQMTQLQEQKYQPFRATPRQHSSYKHQDAKNQNTSLMHSPNTSGDATLDTPTSLYEPRPYQQSSLHDGIGKFSTSESSDESLPTPHKASLHSPDISIVEPNNPSNPLDSAAKRIEDLQFKLKNNRLTKDQLDFYSNIYSRSEEIVRANPNLLEESKRIVQGLQSRLGRQHAPVLKAVQNDL